MHFLFLSTRTRILFHLLIFTSSTNHRLISYRSVPHSRHMGGVWWPIVFKCYPLKHSYTYLPVLSSTHAMASSCTMDHSISVTATLRKFKTQEAFADLAKALAGDADKKRPASPIKALSPKKHTVSLIGKRMDLNKVRFKLPDYGVI